MMRFSGIVVLMLLIACGQQDTSQSEALFRPELEGVGPLRVQKLEQAEERVRQALADKVTDPELARAYGNLAMHYQAYRVDAGAIHYYQKSADLEPQNFTWPYYKARSLRNMSRIDEANELFLEVFRLNPRHVPTLIELGEFARRRNQLEQAKTYFDMALALDTRCVPAMVGLAQIAQMNKKPQRALNFANRALELQGEVGLIHFIAGMSHRELGNMEQAEHHLALQQEYKKNVSNRDDLMKKVFDLGKDGQTHHRAGIKAMEAGNATEAVVYLRDAVASEPNTVAYRVDLAWALLVAGQKEEALATYKEVLPDRQGNTDILYNMGGIIMEQGNLEEALGYFQKIYDLEPENIGAIRHMADIHRLGERFQESLTFYQKMVALQPQNPEGRLGRALMLIRSEQYSEAVKALDEDVKLMPGQPAFNQALIRVLSGASDAKARNGKRAQQLLEQLLKYEADADICETVAMTYAENGHFDKAIQWQQKAITLAGGQNPAMSDILNGYQNNQPRRTVWPHDHPLFKMPTYGR